MEPSATLHEIFDADRRRHEAEEAFLSGPAGAIATALTGAIEEALAADDPDEAARRLVRLADLCAQVPGPRMVDNLLAILDHPDPVVRVEAGEALRDVAFERFKEVAIAIERALDAGRSGLAMQELPFVLTEVRDPDPIPLVARFLTHRDAGIVAAGIEALAGFGDPAAGRYIEPLLEDAREALLDDMDGEPATLGELARAALEELGNAP